MKLFTMIDHNGEAEGASLHSAMRKRTTPLMFASPSIAIDRSMKILLWDDGQRKGWISGNGPSYLQGRYGLPPDVVPNIAAVRPAVKAAE
jgi:hypothetical protein